MPFRGRLERDGQAVLPAVAGVVTHRAGDAGQADSWSGRFTLPDAAELAFRGIAPGQAYRLVLEDGCALPVVMTGADTFEGQGPLQ